MTCQYDNLYFESTLTAIIMSKCQCEETTKSQLISIVQPEF